MKTISAAFGGEQNAGLVGRGQIQKPRVLPQHLARNKVLPSLLDALVLREERRKIGLYGIGLSLNPKNFTVQRINKLIDKNGLERFKDVVIEGDVVMLVDGKPLVQSDDLAMIVGSYNTCVNLKLFSKSTSREYEVELKRHVEIQSWDQIQRWYEVRDEYKGQDLCASAEIVEGLQAIRASVIDRSGNYVDVLNDSTVPYPYNTDSQCDLGLVLGDGAAGIKNCQVTQILVGSPAYYSGAVRIGDQIKSVDLVEANEGNVLKLIKSPAYPGRKILLTIEREGRELEILLSQSRSSSIRAMEQFIGLADNHARHINQKADASTLSASLEELIKHVKNMEQSRIENETKNIDVLQETQAKISNQVLAVERLLRPIRAFSKGLEDLIPLADRENLLLEIDRQKLEIERLKKALAELQMALDKAVAAQTEAQDARRLQALLVQAQHELKVANEEIERLKKLLATMVSRTEYEGLQDQTKNLQSEVERLQKLLDASVPKAKYASALDDLKISRDEIEKLKKRMENMVAQRDFQALEASLKSSQEELDRLKKLHENMVPKSRCESAEQEAARLFALMNDMAPKAEIERLQKQIEGMVGKLQFDATCNEASRLKEQLQIMVPRTELDAKLREIDMLRKQIEGMVPKAELDGKIKEVDRLQKAIATMCSKADFDAKCDEVERLKSSISAMVPKVKHDIALDENRTAKEEIERLKGLMAAMVPKADLEVKLQEIDKLNNTMRSMVPKANYDVLSDELRNAKEEIQRLTKLLENTNAKLDLAVVEANKEQTRLKEVIAAMVPKGEITTRDAEIQRLKKQLEQMVSKDEMKARDSEIERLQKVINAMVQKGKYDSLQDEYNSVAQEIERLKKMIAGMVPRTELEAAQNEVTRTSSELQSRVQTIDLLKKSIESMVAKTSLDMSIEENRRLQVQVTSMKQEIDALNERIVILSEPKPPIFEFDGKQIESTISLWIYSSDPEGMVYCTLDGGDPGPSNMGCVCDKSRVMVTISETTTIKAVCVVHGRISQTSSETFRLRERERAANPERLGVGLLLEVMKVVNGPNDVIIREILPNGSAANEPSVQVGQYLLAVDDQDVTDMEGDEIFGLIGGAVGDSIKLKIAQPVWDSSTMRPDLSSAFEVQLMRSAIQPPPTGPATGPPSQGRSPLSKSSWPPTLGQMLSPSGYNASFSSSKNMLGFNSSFSTGKTSSAVQPPPPPPPEPYPGR